MLRASHIMDGQQWEQDRSEIDVKEPREIVDMGS